jgi:hypothetical protein
MRKMMAILLVTSLTLLLLAFSTLSAIAGQRCKQNEHSISLGRGLSPGVATPWTITASHTLDSCNTAFLRLTFSFYPVEVPSGWSWSTVRAIPAHGHLSKRVKIEAMDNPDLDVRQGEFSGFASSRVRLVIAHFTRGAARAIHPQLPPMSLRRRYPWIDGLASFVIFYRPHRRIVSVEVFDAQGRLIHRAHPNRYGFFS